LISRLLGLFNPHRPLYMNALANTYYLLNCEHKAIQDVCLGGFVKKEYDWNWKKFRNFQMLYFLNHRYDNITVSNLGCAPPLQILTDTPAHRNRLCGVSEREPCRV